MSFREWSKEIVTFVIGVLCTLVIVVNRVEKQTREQALRTTLSQTRAAIDQFSASHGELPRSLDDLVSTKMLNKVLNKVPIDPVTNTEKWQVVVGTKSNGSKQMSVL
jgi:type II secretory pathway pseudopilin PulG